MAAATITVFLPAPGSWCAETTGHCGCCHSAAGEWPMQGLEVLLWEQVMPWGRRGKPHLRGEQGRGSIGQGLPVQAGHVP